MSNLQVLAFPASPLNGTRPCRLAIPKSKLVSGVLRIYAYAGSKEEYVPIPSGKGDSKSDDEDDDKPPKKNNPLPPHWIQIDIKQAGKLSIWSRSVGAMDLSSCTGEGAGPKELSGKTMEIHNLPTLSYTELVRAKLKAYSTRIGSWDGDDLVFILTSFYGKVDQKQIGENQARFFVEKYDWKGDKALKVKVKAALGLE